MNAVPKSACIKLVVGCFCICAMFLMAACERDDGITPHVFGDNEIPASALNEPRVVTTAVPNASAHAAWPRLGDVPPKPTNFTKLPLVDQTMVEMESDRAVAEQKRDEVENPPPFVEPTPASTQPLTMPLVR